MFGALLSVSRRDRLDGSEADKPSELGAHSGLAELIRDRRLDPGLASRTSGPDLEIASKGANC